MRPRYALAITALHFVTAQNVVAANVADFVDYSLRSPRGGVALPGRLLIPPQAVVDPATPRPLMVYLHGGGAAGTNNMTQIEQTPAPLVDEAKARGSYLYVPQTNPTWASELAIDNAMTMINRAIAELNVDPNRLYAFGYSNGAGGVWNLLSRNPRRIAAAFTMSGGAPLASFNPANLLGTAIFTLHARDDASVPVARTRTVVDSILTAAGSTLPNYSAAGSEQHLLVANPRLSFHSLLIDSQMPDKTVVHNITVPDLDLIYFDTYAGGHTGLLNTFYAPAVYDWVFEHSLAAPEPSLFAFVSIFMAIAAVCRCRGKM
jgi:predicted esterase